MPSKKSVKGWSCLACNATNSQDQTRCGLCNTRYVKEKKEKKEVVMSASRSPKKQFACSAAREVERKMELMRAKRSKARDEMLQGGEESSDGEEDLPPAPSYSQDYTDEIQLQPWTTSISDLDNITSAQADELQALQCVFDEVKVRRVGDSVQLQLQGITVEGYNASATATILLPPAYPEVPPRLALHSATIPKECLLDVCEQALEAFTEGTHASYDIIARAEELLGELPATEISMYFCCCLQCNAKLASKGLPKQPQPTDPKYTTCLMCKSQDVVPLRQFSINKDGALCSYCFCEESPLLEIPCGDRICCECMQRWGEVDIGAKKVQIVNGMGCIECAAHPGSFFGSPECFKLLQPRTFNQYNRFVFEKSIEGSIREAVVCPLAGCCNYPFIPSIWGKVVHCPFCSGWFCNQCKDAFSACECTDLGVVQSLRSFPKFSPPSPPPERNIRLRVFYRDTHFDIDTSHNTEQLYHDVADVLPIPSRMFKAVGKEDYPFGEDEWKVGVEHMALYWCGQYIRPGLSCRGLFTGSQIYLLLHFPRTEIYEKEWREETALWKFRRGIAPGMKAEGPNKVGKDCPACGSTVVHYFQHGCHHIGFAGQGCCKNHWCYCCRGTHPCFTCPPFCDPERKCGCPICPDCKPGDPCPSCTGCIQCLQQH